MTNDIINAKNICFSYKNEEVLSDVSFTVEENEFIGLIGPNGAGKSTLLKIMLGFLEPKSGSIRLLGHSTKQACHKVGYVPQHSKIDFDFPIKVIDVVLMGLLQKKKIFHKFNSNDYQQAFQALDKVQMIDFKDEPIHQLSGGQKQRIFLARAIVGQVKLLILDEPISHIDLSMANTFYKILEDLNKSMAIILVTHDIGGFPADVNRIFCLNKKLFCHDSQEEALKNLDQVYGCPFEMLSHGIPHRVLKEHDHD